MATSNTPRVRPSVRYLQDQYDNHDNKKPLEDLVRAWKGIKELPPTDKRSFFVLGGYHGEPFQYRRDVDALSELDRYTYWGGYCNHGNVLFPTWHRVYVLKIEEALQSIVPGVMMPYWDETSKASLTQGIPSILTQEQFMLDGHLIDNPLRSFTLPQELSDNLPGDDKSYAKPKGYQTVRYPLSGLVGTHQARHDTEEHNKQHTNHSENVDLLDQNVVAWLHGAGPKTEGPTPGNPNPEENGIYGQFVKCLYAPNYTVFSNNSSSHEWNKTHKDQVTSLEAPHNDIHLSVGGFDLPGPDGGESGQIAGANGDMGENNTAGLDPIFFFHHCNVDRMFWLWQVHNNSTDRLEIIDGYKGTSSSDSQGPTPNFAPGVPLRVSGVRAPDDSTQYHQTDKDRPLDVVTPLYPFLKDEFGTVYTSEDCVNIETDLGYTYQEGSLADFPEPEKVPDGYCAKKLKVTGIDLALFQGSFVLRAYAKVAGEPEEIYLGHQSILSRRNVIHCANCLTHQEVVVHFSLRNLLAEHVDSDNVEYRLNIHHRGPALHTDLRYRFEVID